MIGRLDTARAIFPPFPLAAFTPNFTGFDLDQDEDWYEMYQSVAPNDSLIHVRNISVWLHTCHNCKRVVDTYRFENNFDL